MLIKRKRYIHWGLIHFDEKYPDKNAFKKHTKEEVKENYTYLLNDEPIIAEGWIDQDGAVLRSNLVGSSIEPNVHAPCIDVDMPVYAVPSRTPGHTHLFFEKEMTWLQYKTLLKAMVDCGLVERGYYNASMQHGQTFLRRASYDLLEELDSKKQETTEDIQV